MKRSLLESEFILILSPSRAPPVRLRVGSTQSKQIFLSGLSLRILSINSSRRLDLPAPPVPVKPITGTSLLDDRQVSKVDLNKSSSALSDMVKSNPTFAISSGVTGPFSVLRRSLPMMSTSLAIPIRW